MPEAAPPRRAATIVVIRPAAAGPGSPFEVLLLRRSAAMTFMAGAHVFPGGSVDDADALVDAPACCDGLDAPRCFARLDAAAELACRVAAARELVEEAGVLLARRHGSFATSEEAEAVRARLDCGASFEQVLRDGGWRLALDALLPFAQIVTPRSEPRRFDTHFFLAELPGGIEARPTGTESDELVWATPARAGGRVERRGRLDATHVGDPAAGRRLRLGRRTVRGGTPPFDRAAGAVADERGGYAPPRDPHHRGCPPVLVRGGPWLASHRLALLPYDPASIGATRPAFAPSSSDAVLYTNAERVHRL